MSDKSGRDAYPRYPQLSELGSANAPILFFDCSSAWGVNDGIVHLSVEATRMVSNAPNPHPAVDRVIVAHLRTTVEGAVTLRNALNDALKKAELIR